MANWSERRVIKWLKEREILLALLALIASVLLGAYQSYLSLRGLTSAQRAWISPYDLKIEGDYSSGGNLRLVVYYRNTGREPAFGVRVASDIAIAKGETKVNWSKRCDRARQLPSGGSVAYPSDSIYYTAPVEVRSLGSAYEVLSGEETLYLNGCITYETFGSSHQSEYCFFLVPNVGQPTSTWSWRFCADGNNAT